MRIIKIYKNSLCKIICRYKYRSAAYVTDEIDLLSRSIVPMNHFQPSIMNLPIPKMEDTLKKYLMSQEAILEKSEFLSTKARVEQFWKDDSVVLLEEFKNFVNSHKNTNYVNVLWTDMYLKDRRPIVLTHNPSIVLKNPKRNTNECAQDIRAANLIFSSIRFFRSLKAGLLEPSWFHKSERKTDTEKFRKLIRMVPSFMSTYVAYFMKVYPLDMSQLKYLFNTTRIPKPQKDEILKFDNAKHLLVIHKGQMYTFDILKHDGHGVDAKQILSNIRFILNSPTNVSHQQPGLGLLTTMTRDKWASTRQLLLDLGNKDALQQIDSAVFVMALDDCSYDNEKDMLDNTLHGNAENRWFDKSFSLIVDSKGEVALNLEHSWGDGIAVKRYIDEIYDDSELNPQFSKTISSVEESNLPQPLVNRLSFNLNSQITEEILPQAKKEYDEKRSLVDFNFLRLEGFGENTIKGLGIGFDSILQLSFQLAHYKLKNRQAASYESVTTSSFKDGRTETLRPATLETNLFCELISKGSASNDELLSALKNCSKKHGELTMECLMGKGWDRYLYGLKHSAERLGKVFDIFTDPNYDNINKIIISTSTVPSDAIEMGGFAAVCQDGYGIAYGVKKDECGAIISTWKQSSYSNGSQFQQALMESLQQISAIVDYSKREATKIMP